MILQEAKAVDLAVDDASVAAAEREAAEAGQAAVLLERAAVDGDKGAGPAALAEVRVVAEVAAKRAARMRERAAAARAANRLLALEAVAGDVTALAQAAAGDGPIAKAITRIAGAAAELAALCAGHDEAVQALMDRAAALGAEPAGPAGPRATSAHVAPVRRSVAGTAGLQSGRTLVRLITSRRAEQAAVLAAQGQPEQALAGLNAAWQQAGHQRADHYYRTPAGHIITGQDPVPAAIAGQLRNGQLAELDAAAITAYLDGRLDGHQPAAS